MKYILIFILSLSFMNPSSQRKTTFKRGTIHFVNGEVYDCKIGFPIKNKSKRLNLNRKSKNKIIVENISGERIKVSNEEIDYILFEDNEGFVKLEWTISYEFTRKRKRKLTDDKSWFMLHGGCEEITSYSWPHNFKLDKQGDIIAEYVGNYGFYGMYYLKKQNEDYPTYISSMTDGTGIGYKKMNKILFEAYFKGDAHAEKFLTDKKKLRVKEIKKYIENRCSNN